MGANVSGSGSDTIEIHGVESLHGAEFSIIPDRIVAGYIHGDHSYNGGRAAYKECLSGAYALSRNKAD